VMLEYVGVSSQLKSERHCLQDCEVIGWAELCERKKLTAGSCFQLERLSHRGSEDCDACVFVAGRRLNKSLLGKG